MSDNNNNNNDGLDDDLEGAEGGFDDFSKQGTLGDLWRNNPLVKIGAVLGVFAVIVGGILLFGTSNVQPPPSVVDAGADVKEAPATNQVTPVYEQAVRDFNQAKTEEAIKTGGSVLPVPVDPPVGRIAPPQEETSAEDPLERWRKLQEERAKQNEAQIQANQQPQQPQVDPRAEAINALAQVMATQMESVLSARTPIEPKLEQITAPGWLAQLREQEASKAQKQAEVQGAGAQGGTDQTAAAGGEEILLPAATIEYAQMLTEANTDAPGPVLVQIVSGPLSGSRMIGEFEAQEEYLVINFETIVVDGISYSAEAVALNPNTTLPGLATEVDKRYLKKIALPMAGAFVEGFADAISESGQTTITINNAGSSTATEENDKSSKQEVATGISEAGAELRELLDEEREKTKTLIRVAAGTPMAVLFLEPVVGGDEAAKAAREDSESRRDRESSIVRPIGNMINAAGSTK